MLAADDPRLAARLAAFGQPGFSQVLRTRRARATLSLMMLVLIAAVAAVIYMMSAFRPGSAASVARSGQHASLVPPLRSLSPAAQQSCLATSPAACGWSALFQRTPARISAVPAGKPAGS